MAETQKCNKCIERMVWMLPYSVTEENYEYAKHCLLKAKKYFVCGHTMKTKPIRNEQYCKHFKAKSKDLIEADEITFKNDIKELEKKIKEYESQKE